MKKYFTIVAILFSFISLKAQVFQEWVQRFNGPDSLSDVANAIDVKGNIYVTGFTTSNASGADFITIKYSPRGELKWMRTYNGPGNGADQAKAIAVDANGNAYVTGNSFGGSTMGIDYATVKYDSLGNELWVARFDRNNQNESVSAIGIDVSGNVYVTGCTGTNFSLNDYATVKYNNAGIQQWAKYYNGPAGTRDMANDLAVDSKGNVIVTGFSTGIGTRFDFATIKYSPAGNQLWVARHNDGLDSNDVAHAIAVDGNDNVYVTGTNFTLFNLGHDFATVKYNSSGAEQWIQHYNGPGNSTDFATDIVVDPAGNVYVTGASVGAGTGFDYATIKYTTNGILRWAQRFDGPAHAPDAAFSIALDKNNNVYVTGGSTGAGTSLDYTTIKYATQGKLEWVQRFNGTANSTDRATAVAVDTSGNVFVTGFSLGTGTFFDFATIKYAQGNFPPGYGGVTLNSKLDMLEFVNEVAYASVMDSLMHQVRAVTGDNGNTQALLTLINSNTPPGQIKNQLIASSPLSDTVLITTINSSLPPGHKKDVLKANVPFTDKVDNAISQSSLPAGTKNEVMNAANSVFVIPNPVLDRFEQLLKFRSLRKDLEEKETTFLKNGGDPENPADPDNHHFVEDEFRRAFFNPRLEVKVGSTIAKYLNDSTLVLITDGSFNTLKQIRQTGQVPRFTPPVTEPSNGIPISQMPTIIPANIRVENTIVSNANLKQFTIADFAANANALNASFINFSSGPALLSYYWDFGDGFGSYQVNPTHTYASAGNKVITLTVTDGLSNNTSFSKTLYLFSCNVNWSSTKNFLAVSFTDYSTSSNHPISYSWDFGDGSTTSSQQNPSHLYSAQGTYTVCLTITDAGNPPCVQTSCKNISVVDPDSAECCDKSDKDKEVWNNYATNRKAKAKLVIRNLWVDHYVKAKTNNYKKTGGLWFDKKVDYIYVTMGGSIFSSTSQNKNWHQECDATAVANCCNLSDSHYNDNKAEVDITNWGTALSNRIFLKQNSISSNHKVTYNGTDYPLGPLLLTNDCPP
ncbi:MAG: SBBP repeat-containing protein [Bacteroidetes bacterium]|nr:SBBP repeat-containing protein [Bacteroidota bacterium]